MRTVDDGKRFVVFQRNMKCVANDKTMNDQEEENDISIPRRKILTGTKNKDSWLTEINYVETNNKPSNQTKKATKSKKREPRKFFVSVASSENDSFQASPVDISKYSATSLIGKKVSFPSKQESNIASLTRKQLFSPSNNLSHISYRPPNKSPKSILTPLEDIPLIFSASASVGQLLNPYQTRIEPTKNIGLTVTYVHSPSTDSTSYQNNGNILSRIYKYFKQLQSIPLR